MLHTALPFKKKTKQCSRFLFVSYCVEQSQLWVWAPPPTAAGTQSPSVVSKSCKPGAGLRSLLSRPCRPWHCTAIAVNHDKNIGIDKLLTTILRWISGDHFLLCRGRCSSEACTGGTALFMGTEWSRVPARCHFTSSPAAGIPQIENKIYGFLCGGGWTAQG